MNVIYRRSRIVVALLVSLVLLVAGCSGSGEAERGAPEPPATAASAPAPPAPQPADDIVEAAAPGQTAAPSQPAVDVTPAEPASDTAEPAPPIPAPQPEPQPAPAEPVLQPVPPLPEPQPTPTEPAPAEPAAAPASAGRIEVAATKPGLSRIGADKCKTCHKVQYASWAESGHAALDPPLDCESCHGPGSEYKALSIMKDRAKAEAAGLVDPGAAFCTASCHTEDWQDDMLGRAHAHKQS